MRKIPLLLLFTLCTFLSLHSFSQQKTGQVCFIRATGYVGSAVNFRVYIDDTLACKLKNKRYSLHTVSVGKHTVAAQNTGISTYKKSDAFEVEVKEGKVTYVDVVWANKVYCQEITASSGEMKLKTVKQTTDCQTKDQ